MFLMSLRWSLDLFYAGFYKYIAPTVLPCKKSVPHCGIRVHSAFVSLRRGKPWLKFRAFASWRLCVKFSADYATGEIDP